MATGPGETALTRIPRGASSRASVWVRLSMPALAAAYGPVRGEPRVPAPDEMLMITPPDGHAGGRRLGALERRREVELELGAPDVVGRVDQLADRLLVRSADVVDPHVEAAELGDVRSASSLGEVADVGVGDQRSPPALETPAAVTSRSARRRALTHDVAAGIGQPPRDGSPDALSGTGHDGNPTVEPEQVEQAHGPGSVVDLPARRSSTGGSLG